ncbi:MAG: AAA family ATPase [Anaerolineales bacterium]|nr:AAA family ATPase [Anaerolineales bacterium]
MTYTIALAGKGGTGKTTLTALLVKTMLGLGKQPILAIDADPSTNLHLALGLPEPRTIGDIREEMAEDSTTDNLGVAISRVDFLNREIQLALEESSNIDLIAMGRPEGPGCYCAVNHMLRQLMDDLCLHYPFVVMDNEAGMEHISRRTTRDVDLLILVTDPTIRGLKAAAAMLELANNLNIAVHRSCLVLNRLAAEMPPQLEEAVQTSGLTIGAVIPADPEIGRLDAVGAPLIDVSDNSPAFISVQKFAAKYIGGAIKPRSLSSPTQLKPQNRVPENTS